ncbi:MAG: hypothetical protein M3Y28_02250 [Armatimonadota bacterium]|nr:hypothetical protein [Armatimonadota bacterium]
MTRQKTVALRLLSLGLATALWLPCLHLYYAQPATEFAPPQGVSPLARQLSAQQLSLWNDPDAQRRERDAMRRTNPEWDFMGRTYLVWALANMGLRDPASQPKYLASMDRIIDDTLTREKQNGLFYFLMPYAQSGPFVQQPAHSQFLDGEIALMLAMRRVVAEKPAYKLLLTARVNCMVARMEASPTLSAESYPDECWTFCNALALDAIKTADYLDGTDHSDLMCRWVALAKVKLTDPKTGLIVSSYTLNGRVTAGPQGSSIWMVVHSLQLIDPVFAQDQYRRARRELSRSVLGFGYAREWPESWTGPMNVDSGVVLPGTDISPGGTGMAFLGAASFGDAAYLRELTATLQYSAFPVLRDGRLRYAASNQVGDAVVLYSAVMGPMWRKISLGAKQ